MLLNEEMREPAGKIATLLYWKTNPLFYVGIAMAIFSFACFVIHTGFGFTIGIGIALVSMCASVWISASIFTTFYAKPRLLSGMQRLKQIFFAIVFIAGWSGLAYVQILQLQVAYAPGAADPSPAWTDFPMNCTAVCFVDFRRTIAFQRSLAQMQPQ